MGIVIALVQKQAGEDRALLAARLAHHWSKKDRKVGLIDLDSKKYLTRWANTHLATGLSLQGSQMWRLKTDINICRAKHDITIIDCPTHPDHLYRSVSRLSDLIIAPCLPNTMSTHAIETIQRIAREEDTPCCVVLNHVSDHNANYDKALLALQQQQARILNTQLGNRISFHSGFYHEKSLPSQQTEHSGWNEVESLRKELEDMLDLVEAA